MKKSRRLFIETEPGNKNFLAPDLEYGDLFFLMVINVYIIMRKI